MRRIITMLLFAMTAAVAAYAQKAQYKVEESSAKKMPEWVMSTEKDYLIVTATGGDIEEAKAAVIESVKRQIAQSIATRIVAESNLQTSAFESGDSFSKSQSLETSVMSRTAKLPFIGEISLSKAADYYWERRYYRSTGRYDYFYAVKYPFSDFETGSQIQSGSDPVQPLPRALRPDHHRLVSGEKRHRSGQSHIRRARHLHKSETRTQVQLCISDNILIRRQCSCHKIQ